MLYNCGVKHKLGATPSVVEQQVKKRKMFDDIIGGPQETTPDKRTTKNNVRVKEEIKVEEEPTLIVPVKAKKVKKDRAERYREELARLGIIGFESQPISGQD